MDMDLEMDIEMGTSTGIDNDTNAGTDRDIVKDRQLTLSDDRVKITLSYFAHH
jgi:hypothetical protein